MPVKCVLIMEPIFFIDALTECEPPSSTTSSSSSPEATTEAASSMETNTESDTEGSSTAGIIASTAAVIVEGIEQSQAQDVHAENKPSAENSGRAENGYKVAFFVSVVAFIITLVTLALVLVLVVWLMKRRERKSYERTPDDSGIGLNQSINEHAQNKYV